MTATYRAESELMCVDRHLCQAREAIHRLLMTDRSKVDPNEITVAAAHAQRLLDDLANLRDWQGGTPPVEVKPQPQPKRKKRKEAERA